jgi:hypothetical protein
MTALSELEAYGLSRDVLRHLEDAGLQSAEQLVGCEAADLMRIDRIREQRAAEIVESVAAWLAGTPRPCREYWEPSPEEIAAECAKIRERWSDAEFPLRVSCWQHSGPYSVQPQCVGRSPTGEYVAVGVVEP